MLLFIIKITDLNFAIQPASKDSCANAGNACANVGNIPTHDQNPRSKFLRFSLLAKMQVSTLATHVPTSAISLITIKIPDPNAWIQPACENACANAGNVCANVSNIPMYD